MKPFKPFGTNLVSPVRSRVPGNCRHCLAPALRRSRFRRADFAHLVLLTWPVRCMDCRKRQYGSFREAMQLASASEAHRGAFGSAATWKDFTGEAALQAPAPRKREKGAA